MSGVMLYRHPGTHEMHGDFFDYVVVQEDGQDEYLANGWHCSTTEALAHTTHKPPKTKKQDNAQAAEDFDAKLAEIEQKITQEAAQNREFMERLAAWADVKYRADISDAKLRERLTAAIVGTEVTDVDQA